MRPLLRYIQSLFFWLSAFVITVALFCVSNAAAPFIRDRAKRQDEYRRFVRLWGYLLAGALPFRVEVSGLENIPRDMNVIFAPNHQSYLDIFILLKYIPVPFRYIIMRQLFKFPMIGHNIKRAGFPCLDRKDRKNSIETIDHVVDLLKKGESFVIFPEGMLTRDGSVREFNRGASIIIQRSRKPVVPVAIDGTFSVLPKGAWIMRPSPVRLKFGRPVSFENYYDRVDKETSLKLGEDLRGVVSELKSGDSAGA